MTTFRDRLRKHFFKDLEIMRTAEKDTSMCSQDRLILKGQIIQAEWAIDTIEAEVEVKDEENI